MAATPQVSPLAFQTLTVMLTNRHKVPMGKE